MLKKKVWVNYKGGISSLINKDEEVFEIKTDLSLKSLITIIFGRNKNLSANNSFVGNQSVLVMLNENFIPQIEYESIRLKAGDIITLFPTVSGG